MITAPSHPRETERLALLRECQVLDTAEDPDFDGLAALAAHLVGAPIALVSLIDESRQWFKAHHGLAARETPRTQAFCAHAILDGAAHMVVTDARRDPRFAENPLVTGDPNIVFYAGVPLKLGRDGLAVGTLCVIDRQPRELTPSQHTALRVLARQVEVLLEQRLRQGELVAALARERQERVRRDAILAALDEGIIVQNREGALLEANAAAERILGVSCEQLRGTTTADPRFRSVHPDGSAFPVSEHPIEVALATGEPVGGVVMGVGPSDDVRWLLVNARPMARDEQGRALEAVASFTDVTPLRSEEERRRQAERRFERTFEASSDYLCILDREGRLQRVNGTWAVGLSWAKEELLGTPLLTFVHPEDHEATRAAIEGVPPRPEVAAFENRCRCKDGTFRLLDWSAVFIEAHGTAFLAGRDVTKQRDIERDLRAAKEAAEIAARAKATFLASMSHEIRTPMAGVIGMLDELLDGGLPAAQRDCAETARRSAHALLAILNDILDFSRIESGQLSIESVAFDAAALVRDCVLLFRATTSAKGLELLAEVGGAGRLDVVGDPARIRQVLLNLISNAIKFTEHGRVELRVHVEVEAGGRATFVADVQDTGIGMSQDTLNRLFVPFAQAEDSTYRRFGGTGLGLAISRRLCELMGGALSVATQEGHGSTFTMRVPTRLVDVGKVAVEKTQVPALGALAGRVLVAEDDAVNRKIIASLLRRLGLAVELVENGLRAVESTSAQPFDLVLMDCQMPVMGGLEATRAIRAREGGFRHTPIVALTANAFDEDQRQCYDAGMDGYLTKPLDRAALARVLERWLPKG